MSTVLGIGALASIFLLILGVTIHAALSNTHNFSQATGPHDTVVPRSMLGTAAAAGLQIAPPMELPPVEIGDRWRRLETDSEVSPAPGSTAQRAIATYLSGTHFVHVWVDQLSNPAFAQARMTQMLKASTVVHTSSGNETLLPNSNLFYGHRSSVMDIDDSNGDPAEGIAGAPGMSEYPHTRSWVSGQKLVTVSSDTVEDRDDFSRDFLDYTH